MIHQPDAAIIQLHRRLGDAKLLRLLKQFSVGESVSALAELQARHGVQASARFTQLAQTLMDRNVRVITLLDLEYPIWLRTVEPDPPPMLYVQGNMERLSALSIAIIGTRRPTAPGRAAARQLAHAAAEQGWTIVSGNAPGVDCAGHTAALETDDGETLVFPAAALDQYQPVFRNGTPERVTAASPFIPGSEIMPWMFLRRNSFVASQCRAAFVAETGVRGGTLDTVKKLTTLHRPTFATLLPADARYANAHSMLAAGAVDLIDILNDSADATRTVLEAARKTPTQNCVQAAILQDLFDMEEHA